MFPDNIEVDHVYENAKGRRRMVVAISGDRREVTYITVTDEARVNQGRMFIKNFARWARRDLGVGGNAT